MQTYAVVQFYFNTLSKNACLLSQNEYFVFTYFVPQGLYIDMMQK